MREHKMYCAAVMATMHGYTAPVTYRHLFVLLLTWILLLNANNESVIRYVVKMAFYPYFSSVTIIRMLVVVVVFVHCILSPNRTKPFLWNVALQWTSIYLKRWTYKESIWYRSLTIGLSHFTTTFRHIILDVYLCVFCRWFPTPDQITKVKWNWKCNLSNCYKERSNWNALKRIRVEWLVGNFLANRAKWFDLVFSLFASLVYVFVRLSDTEWAFWYKFRLMLSKDRKKSMRKKIGYLIEWTTMYVGCDECEFGMLEIANELSEIEVFLQSRKKSTSIFYA